MVGFEKLIEKTFTIARHLTLNQGLCNWGGAGGHNNPTLFLNKGNSLAKRLFCL